MRGCNHGFSADLLSPKTASYAVMHLVVATLVAYALTLDWRKALAIGIVEPFVQTFAFALHDRYWRRREQSSVALAAGAGGAPVTSSVTFGRGFAHFGRHRRPAFSHDQRAEVGP